MSIQELLENRVSTSQSKMTGGKVSDEHIKQALKTTTTAPIHGKDNPFHFVVYNYESRMVALDMIYKTKAENLSRAEFDENWGGIGTIIFMFIKKGISRHPDYEAEYAGSAATYGMELSFIENGYCVKWNSVMDEQPMGKSIMKDLGLSQNEYKALGMLLVGTGKSEAKDRPDFSEYTYWK